MEFLLPSIQWVLILVMILMGLLLAHGIVTRRKKEQVEESFHEKEQELEFLKRDQHIKTATYMEENYEKKIESLKEEKKKMMMEYEDKLSALEEKYDRDLNTLTSQRKFLTEKLQKIGEEESDISIPEILDELKEVTTEQIREETSLIKVREQKVDLLKENLENQNPLLEKMEDVKEILMDIEDVLSEKDVHSQTRFISGKNHVQSLFDALNAEENMMLATQRINHEGAQHFIDALPDNLNENSFHSILIGFNHLLNVSQDGVADLIAMVKFAEQHDNIQVRGVLDLPFNMLIFDDNWAIFGSYHWLYHSPDLQERISLQILDPMNIVVLKEAYLKTFNSCGMLSVLSGNIDKLGKKDNNILLKMEGNIIFINSKQLNTIVKDLQRLQERNQPIETIVIKKPDNSLHYLGHSEVGGK